MIDKRAWTIGDGQVRSYATINVQKNIDVNFRSCTDKNIDSLQCYET